MMSRPALSQVMARTNPIATVTWKELEADTDHTMFSTYSRIEEASTDAEEDPHVDGQRETKGERDVQQCLKIHRVVAQEVVGNLRASEGKEQEQEGADEFADASNEKIASSVGEP